jgi:membrane protease subunit HflK
METVIKPKVTIVRRIEVGFRTVDPGPPPKYRPVIQESLMLTGDENIIDLWFIVQYRISDAQNFLFKVADPVKTLTDAAEAAMRGVMGDNKIDEALTAGKFKIQNDAQNSLQEILDKYESGITVVAVQLQAVHPPEQVRDAFRDVVSAREEKNQTINEAQGYANDILPKAKGQAAQLERQAEGYKQEKVERAFGDASRFLAQLEEYRKAKDVTRQRLYLETLESVLPDARKFVFDPEVQKVLPLLPLQGLESPKPAAE